MLPSVLSCPFYVGAVRVLVSADADFITRQTINVDGGIVKH
jgi:hypothetical protein